MFLLITCSVLNEVLDIEEEDTEDEEGDSTSIENGVETHYRLVSLICRNLKLGKNDNYII